MKIQLWQILPVFKSAADHFTTFMAKAYVRPELCIEFQGGWV